MTLVLANRNARKRHINTGESAIFNYRDDSYDGFNALRTIAAQKNAVFEKLFSIHYSIDYSKVIPNFIDFLAETFVRRIPYSYSDSVVLPFIEGKFNADRSTTTQILLSLSFFDMLKDVPHPLPQEQYRTVNQVIGELSNKEEIISMSPIFRYSADNEVCVIRGSERGNHYIIIGEDENDISYGFVGKNKGEYDSLHAGCEGIGIDEIVNAFINN
jgi:hypothetical protein